MQCRIVSLLTLEVTLGWPMLELKDSVLNYSHRRLNDTGWGLRSFYLLVAQFDSFCHSSEM